MRFLDLYISGFGKFHDTAVSFEDGLNVIYGKNEAGKSTIHTFIRGMLFGIERQRGRAARNDIYSKYEPWENSGPLRGSSGLNPTTAPFTGSSARSRKIRRNLPSSTRRPDARNRTAAPFCRKFWAA